MSDVDSMILRTTIGSNVVEFHTVERCLFEPQGGFSAERDAYGFWNGEISDKEGRKIKPLLRLSLLNENLPLLIVGEGDCGKSVFLADLTEALRSHAEVRLIRLRDYCGVTISALNGLIEEILKTTGDTKALKCVCFDGLDENVDNLSKVQVIVRYLLQNRVRVIITTRPYPNLCKCMQELGFKELRLAPLTQEDAARIAADLGIEWKWFSKIAAAKQILSICPRPEMLVQILRLYRQGRFDDAKVENLFAGLALNLCREHRDGKPMDGILRSDGYSDDEICDCVGWIAAALRLQNRQVVSMSAEECVEALPLDELVVEKYPEQLLRSVLLGRLFEPVTTNTFRIGVDDMIPYLAARWIHEHLSTDNAYMLLVDKENPDSKRLYGVLGWMACFRPGFANDLLLERPEFILTGYAVDAT